MRKGRRGEKAALMHTIETIHWQGRSSICSTLHSNGISFTVDSGFSLGSGETGDDFLATSVWMYSITTKIQLEKNRR